MSNFNDVSAAAAELLHMVDDMLDVQQRIIEEHPRCTCHEDCDACVTCGIGSIWPCQTLRLLTLLHAGHGDYLDEWRPDAA